MEWKQYRGSLIGGLVVISLFAILIYNNVDWRACLEPEAEGFVLSCVAENTSAWYARYGVVMRQATVSGLLIGGVYGLVALGLTMIFGVLEIINFAHGALMTVGLYITFILFDTFGIDPYLGLFITVPLLFFIGLIVYRVVIHPARDAPHHNQLLLTLGLTLLIENLLLMVFTATPRAIRLDYGRGETNILGLFVMQFPIRIWRAVITFDKLLAFLGALVVTAILYTIIQKTDLGKAIRATAQERDGAALVGINTDWINMITFGIGTACVGAAAALVLPFRPADPTAGNLFNITAFIIVVLGGMGNAIGALLGGLIIGLTQELTGIFFPGSPDLIGVFVIFILVLLFRPQGLLGQAA
ncbi:MAG: branched-chain amino acid ABC transporter permease [Anaerolineae bacterium]|nr:branched-chain amino acid ABC transporter permease [Anaerolineae bacterium]